MSFNYFNEGYLGIDVMESIFGEVLGGPSGLKVFQSLQSVNKEFNRISWNALPVNLNRNSPIRTLVNVWNRKLASGMERNGTEFEMFHKTFLKFLRHPKYVYLIEQLEAAASLGLIDAVALLSPRLQADWQGGSFVAAIKNGMMEVVQFYLNNWKMSEINPKYYDVWSMAMFSGKEYAPEILKLLLHHDDPHLKTSAIQHQAFISFQPVNSRNPKILQVVSERFQVDWVTCYKSAIEYHDNNMAIFCREKLTQEQLQKCSRVLLQAIKEADQDNTSWMLKNGVLPGIPMVNLFADVSTRGLVGILKDLIETFPLRSEDKRYILNQTVQAGQFECVQFLLERDETWDPSDGENMALDIAHRTGNTKIFEYLKKDQRVKKMAQQKGCIVS